MDGEKLIESMESPSKVSLDWYYHAFRYSSNDFLDLLSTGIQCNKLQGRRPDGYNGKYYISLYKVGTLSLVSSAYRVYKDTASIIVKDINPILCKKRAFYGLFENSILPFRTSSFDDEYQQFWRIDSEKYAGIRVPLLKWYKKGIKTYLENVRQMLLIMQERGVDLPIYDSSRESDEDAHILNQEMYLEYADFLISSTDGDRKLNKTH